MDARKTNHFYTYIFSKRVFLVLTLCVFVASCSRRQTAAPQSAESPPPAENAININTAPAAALARIPHIGEKLAGRIVAYRETHGPFRRPEHLMLVDGISDKKFRMLRQFIKTE
jgi:competence ComEA-like helix-hairpin-helix protein